MRLRTLLPVLTTIAVLTVAFAACGGDDDDVSNDDGQEISSTSDIVGDDDDGGIVDEGDDSGDDGGNSGGLSACDLVGEGDVEQAVGGTVASSRSDDGAALTGCDFVMEDGGTVTVDIFIASSEDVAQENYEAVSLGLEEPVTGLGEAAKWFPDYAALHVLTGVYGITVQIATTPNLGTLEQARPLMEQVLAGLP